MNLLDQICFNESPGPFYEEDANDLVLPGELPVRLIAYYLPQFHPIPENDEWWGKGFTEWTNVTKAIPRYVGHYQPRLPGALGFYDLRMVEALRQQAALAKRHGVGGFCFHYYWFGGRKLLDTPLNLLLANPDIDLPFCINWANENWTRTWDGEEKKVLLQQLYSAEDDLAFALALEPMLSDPRYIRINGRPMILLYRPKQLPDALATIMRWREHFVSRGFGDPYFVMPQVFSDQDPREFGMDAACDFPPHTFGQHRLSKQLALLDNFFHGEVNSYPAMVQTAMERQPVVYRHFHGVCPDWDNEARRTGCGGSFLGSTPQVYGRWLASACRKALSNPNLDERIVFVNAWNEWAEGAYLEPDRHFGYAYIRETARVLAREDLAEAPHHLPSPLLESVNSVDVTKLSSGMASRFIRRIRFAVGAAFAHLALWIRPF